MKNSIVLVIGFGVSAIAFIRFTYFHGLFFLLLTAIVFAILGYRNRRRVLEDPEKMRALGEKKRRVERRLGLHPLFLDLPAGIDARGVIKKITDTTVRFEDNPKLELSLDVFPDDGPQYETIVAKYVPLILLPQFQPGKEFQLKIDPNQKDEISFMSCVTPEGQVIDFSDYALG